MTMTIDRRCFLSASAVAILAGASNLNSASYADSPPNPPQFYGNPNCDVTVIEGRIFVSRRTGQAPCFIHASASDVTCRGTRVLGVGLRMPALPYEDLEFSWDFGDRRGEELFTRPTDGATVNANRQIGPEALYCYRRPGSYTITLVVRGRSGGQYTTA